MTKRLTFPIQGILELLEEVRRATTPRTLYGSVTGKGLWLVGDDGVYLMANTADGPRARARKGNDRHFVVYAAECDPHRLDFETWWANKRESFGADDGVEFIPVETVTRILEPAPPGKKPAALIIHCSPGSVRLSVQWKRVRTAASTAAGRRAEP